MSRGQPQQVPPPCTSTSTSWVVVGGLKVEQVVSTILVPRISRSPLTVLPESQSPLRFPLGSNVRVTVRRSAWTGAKSPNQITPPFPAELDSPTHPYFVYKLKNPTESLESTRCSKLSSGAQERSANQSLFHSSVATKRLKNLLSGCSGSVYP